MTNAESITLKDGGKMGAVIALASLLPGCASDGGALLVVLGVLAPLWALTLLRWVPR